MEDIVLERAYADEKTDGYRILVDRLWPQGVSKEELDHDEWVKEIAPSDELRERFNHDREKWQEFREKYKEELKEKEGKVIQLLEERPEGGKLVLLFAAKDVDHNNAVVLKDFMEEKIQGKI
jgi:uncharacterized protein YeaO (DUF488 family)